MINSILLSILILIGIIQIFIGIHNLKKFDSLKESDFNTDISLIQEVVDYIASKGKDPIIGEDNYNVQYFAYKTENNEIMNITPIEDIGYSRNTSEWKRRRAELFKIVDEFLEENK